MVQKIELGKLLPPEMADRVSVNTGISSRWLLQRTSPASPILDFLGQPYNRAMFDAVNQAENGQRMISKDDCKVIWMFTDSIVGQFLRMVLGSIERNDFFKLAPAVAAQFQRWQTEGGFGLSELLSKEIESARIHDAMRSPPRLECFTIEQPKKLPNGESYPKWLKPAPPGVNQKEYDKAKAGLDAPPKLCEVVTIFRKMVDQALERQFKDVNAVKRTPADEKADQLLHSAGFLMPVKTIRTDNRPFAVHAAAESKQLQQLQEFIGLLDSYSVAPRSRKGEVLRLLQKHPAYERCRQVFIVADRHIRRAGLERRRKTPQPSLQPDNGRRRGPRTVKTAKVRESQTPTIRGNVRVQKV